MKKIIKIPIELCTLSMEKENISRENLARMSAKLEPNFTKDALILFSFRSYETLPKAQLFDL